MEFRKVTQLRERGWEGLPPPPEFKTRKPKPTTRDEQDPSATSLIDPTTIAPHDTFYLEDGNVEVLCGNTLFRVHTSILSSHSPALRRMFAQAGLASAESPNGCPRILSSDPPRDFATLLKMMYLPGYVTLLLRRWMIPLTVYLQIP